MKCARNKKLIAMLPEKKKIELIGTKIDEVCVLFINVLD